eukprot:5928945-Pyramimonas_sp.AAC.1
MRYVFNTLTNTKLKDNTAVLIEGDFNEDLTTTTHENTDTPLTENDKSKLDKERSLGYVRRAKRRQCAGDEQTFKTLIRIKQ